MKRVVITGMAAITPIGNEWESIALQLQARKNGIVSMQEWAKYKDMDCHLAGIAKDYKKPAEFDRKNTRSMGKVALMAAITTNKALKSSGLLGHHELLSNGLTGIAFGSCLGSPPSITDFGDMLNTCSTLSINANSYIKFMPHTAAVNIGVLFKLRGRIYPTSSACTSGSQAIGYAYEAIKHGQQNVMIAGGAEELSPTQTAVFDTLFATSTKNCQPALTPRPFDKNRDGLVIGEGSGTLILEELEHAKARNAPIHAEIIGFATNADGTHVTNPNKRTMKKVMQLALHDAATTPDKIGYISAHGTATEQGDIHESIATYEVFGSNTPISSLKSYTGHTLGACGALEAITAIYCMNENWFYPTINLNEIDPLCGKLDYIKSNIREHKTDRIMSNNFAFGGINTSLIFKRWSD